MFQSGLEKQCLLNKRCRNNWVPDEEKKQQQGPAPGGTQYMGTEILRKRAPLRLSRGLSAAAGCGGGGVESVSEKMQV